MTPNRTENSARPLRKDAEQNRELIIRSAAAVFARRGQQVDVREIARCAGVGMGTLYRHFPTKELLIETVLHQTFQAWVEEAGNASEREPDAWMALQSFIHDSVARQAGHRALLEALTSSFDEDSGMIACATRIRPLVSALVEDAHRAGMLRSDVGADDILALVTALGQMTAIRSNAFTVAWEKYVEIVIDGLRSDRSVPNNTMEPARDRG